MTDESFIAMYLSYYRHGYSISLITDHSLVYSLIVVLYTCVELCREGVVQIKKKPKKQKEAKTIVVSQIIDMLLQQQNFKSVAVHTLTRALNVHHH